MGVALTSRSKFGFQLQNDADVNTQGYVVSGDPIWLPIIGSCSFGRQTNPELLQLADRNNYDRLMHSRGKWWSGSVTLLLCPGAADALMQWIRTREDVYRQGYWATVWVVDGLLDGFELPRVRTAMDVKVARASFDFSAQAAVSVTLDLVGITDGANFAPTGYTDKVLTPPYIFKDVVVVHKPSVGLNSGADEVIHCKSVSVSIDNSLDDPSEGLRLNGSYFPITLYNNGEVRVTGSVTRDVQTTYLAEAYILQTEDATAAPSHDWYESTYDGYLSVQIARGSGVITINMANIRYTDWSIDINGSRYGVQTESASFIALTDSTDTVEPIELDATGG